MTLLKNGITWTVDPSHNFGSLMGLTNKALDKLNSDSSELSCLFSGSTKKVSLEKESIDRM